MLRPTEVNDGAWHNSAAGVSAVSVTVFAGVAGLLLEKVSVVVLGLPSSARDGSAPGVMYQARRPGGTPVPGTRNSGELEAIAEMTSGATPLFVTVTSRSRVSPTHTCPRLPVSTTLVVMMGAPPVPLTCTCRCAPAGLLLVMVSVALFGPTLIGWNRMGTLTAVPDATVNGNEVTCAAWKSGALDVRLVTVNGQLPGFEITSGWSRSEPGVTVPKSPASAIIVVIAAARRGPT